MLIFKKRVQRGKNHFNKKVNKENKHDYMSFFSHGSLWGEYMLHFCMMDDQSKFLLENVKDLVVFV